MNLFKTTFAHILIGRFTHTFLAHKTGKRLLVYIMTAGVRLLALAFHFSFPQPLPLTNNPPGIDP